jgi:hypothetical protein
MTAEKIINQNGGHRPPLQGLGVKFVLFL